MIQLIIKIALIVSQIKLAFLKWDLFRQINFWVYRGRLRYCVTNDNKTNKQTNKQTNKETNTQILLIILLLTLQLQLLQELMLLLFPILI